MTDGLLVRVGPLTFHGRRSSAPGFYVAPDGFSGWNDGVSPRRDTDEIPLHAGSYDVPEFPSSRVVVISGYCRARTRVELGHMQAQLTGLLLNGPRQIVVTEFGRTQRAPRMRMGAQPRFDASVEELRADYQLTLWSADPRKFGESRRFVDGEPAYHFGNFAATPRIRVGGDSGDGYTIFGPAGRQYIVGAYPGQGEHVIDMATGRLLIDGAVVPGASSRAQTWTVPPGQTLVHTATPGVDLEVDVVDTFI